MKRRSGVHRVDRRVPSYVDGAPDEPTRTRLAHLTSAHVDSFDYFLSSGMHAAVEDMGGMELLAAGPGVGETQGPHIAMHFDSIRLNAPVKRDDGEAKALTPREARERGLSYAGAMTATVKVVVDAEAAIDLECALGDFPIMVQSERCHLRGRSPQQLVALREEELELGGYFIVNGIERIVRLLQVPRRNYAAAIERSSYRKRGPAYTDRGVAMRCARRDQSSITVTLHYLSTGGMTLRLVIRKQEFLLPAVLVARALGDISDKELYERVLQMDHANTFVSARLELLLRDAKQYGVHSRRESLAYLGRYFRAYLPVSDLSSDEDAGLLLVQRYLFVHTASRDEKLDCLLHMMRKLLAFAQGRCRADNSDALSSHELLLPGHLFSMFVREKLEEVLMGVRAALLKDARTNRAKFLADILTPKYFGKQFERLGSSLGTKARSFLSTGNLVSMSGMDLMQVSGFAVVAERLNVFRYLSHFQSVHRGQFFTTMKTTAVRKLLPESWGFLCPVHTPDGSPCGLLNHLARNAAIVAFPTHDKLPMTPAGRLSACADRMQSEELRRLLVAMGVVPGSVGGADGQLVLGRGYLSVLLDGVFVGGVPAHKAADLVLTLRRLKVAAGSDGLPRVDPTMEVAYIPAVAGPEHRDAYPGVYLFTQPGRLIRAVQQLASGRVEWIGPMEQVYLDIACLDSDLRPETTHAELSPTVMLSHVAALTPFSDYNQSPRNMYQCQMGKQTMGTPAHALRSRADNKLYRIQSPQAPLVQTQAYGEYLMDEYPQGTNAVVAVISYTGYDMEDAMIISKTAFERGFGHGSMYKTAVIDLDEEERSASSEGVRPSLRFCNIQGGAAGGDGGGGGGEGPDGPVKFVAGLDVDGLPLEGDSMRTGDAVCCFVDEVTGKHRVVKHKELEDAVVDTVRVLGTGSSAKKPSVRRVSITLRYRRNPIIGDKFSSRHGQKGTLSVLWPQENMPFSESGMSPDVLINPHAFPSRMTIGMLIESMAGKSGALHGHFQDATPFQFHEKQRAVDYIGEQLLSAGYGYYGSEPLYSGLSGREMHADIFIGVVYYQRLRHMVSDKSQVRATGPVMAVTRQPVKGRKKHGGIRLGEMERDALLSHGVAFCLQDRLMSCSDAHLAFVCALCGGLLPVTTDAAAGDSLLSEGVQRELTGGVRTARRYTCSHCLTARHIRAVQLPYVYRYLTNELAGMGIKMTLTMQD